MIDSEKKARQQRGVVVSTKMAKTIIVRVDWKVKHPIYGKFMARSTRYAVHDESNVSATGDKVLISECRPFSKTKSWKLVEVLEKVS